MKSTSNTGNTTPTTIFLIRHAETEGNLARICQGQTIGGKLSKKGRQHARKLRKWIGEEGIEIVYCSPLSRAVETARIVFGNKKIITEPLLIEQHFGRLSKKTPEQIFEILAKDGFVLPGMKKQEKQPWMLLRHSSKYGGETEEAVFSRGREAIIKTAKKHPGKKVALIAHGRFNKIVLCKLLGFDFDSAEYGKILQENTCVNIIRVKGKKAKVICMNQTGHLGPKTKGKQPPAKIVKKK